MQSGLLMLLYSAAVHAANPMVSLGNSHALALRSDGTVLAWGSDQYGQLGLGRTLISTVPEKIQRLSQVRSIAGGESHSLAVRQDGTVWAWGRNDVGQLGDGSFADRSSPVQVQGLGNAVTVCAGVLHSAALGQDGSVWTWGVNWYGQLGNGTTGNSFPPAQVAGLGGATAIACYGTQTLALLQDGTVRAWGQNANGELGDGSTTDRALPVRVSGLSEVVAINGTAALKRDGTVWQWGYTGQAPNLVPVAAPGISGAVALGLTNGRDYGTRLEAVKADGVTWWHWASGASPALQAPQGTIKAIASSTEFTLLLKSDGSVATAGVIGSGWGWVPNFQPVTGLSNVVALATGNTHALALDVNGNVWTWGDDAYGQLGRGAQLSNTVPTAVPGLSNIVQVAAGVGSSLALDQAGGVWAWGNNYDGQLGDGTSINRSTPVRITGLQDIRALAVATGKTSMAIKRDGTVWVWGNNQEGQAGNGTTGDRSAPAMVTGLSNVVAIAAATHMLAVQKDGTVWAWGRNSQGELGLGNTTSSAVPQQIPGLVGITSVAAGGAAEGAHSFAVTTGGSVMAWGSGALGDGPWRTGQLTPVPVLGLTHVVEVATAPWHTLARRTDGSVWGWGTTWYSGQGSELGSMPRSWTPVPIGSTGQVDRISAAEDRSALFGSDGLLYMGGANAVGELGDGTFAEHPGFVLALDPGGTGFANLTNASASKIPAALQTPFFVASSGGVNSTSANVTTTTRFNPADVGKTGAVFITATVPTGSTLAQSAKGSRAAIDPLPSMAAAAEAGAFTLLQLTSTGWQTVTSGQLQPYASGVLGDQLAAQTILNNTDTSTLKGAEFCVGYGSTAQDMVTNGNIRAVATIPGGTASTSCVVGGTLSVALSVVPGWNLLGNPVNQSIAVASRFSDASKVNSVWKWDSTAAKWQFYSPSLSSTELQSFAASQGYAVLSEIQAGDGFWVNAKTQVDLGTFSGSAINLRQSSLASGWNLVATASAITPQDFNLSLSTTPPTAGQVPINLTSLWAWDRVQSRWYFYTPSLEAGAHAQFIQSQGYRDFGEGDKTLGSAGGFWVKRQ